MCRYVHLNVNVHRVQKRTLDSPDLGVTGSCERPSVGAGNWTVPLQEQQVCEC